MVGKLCHSQPVQVGEESGNVVVGNNSNIFSVNQELNLKFFLKVAKTYEPTDIWKKLIQHLSN